MRLIWILAIAILASLTISAQSITLATYQYADNPRVKNLQPLADHMKATYGYDVKVKSYPTVHDFVNAIRNNEVDIALINVFGYLLLESSANTYPMRPVAMLQVNPDAKNNYTSAIVVNTNAKNVKSLAELKTEAKHLRLALVSKGSTSGNLVPRMAMAGIGLSNPDSSFRSLIYARTHAGAIDSLLAGNVDIASMGSAEYEKLKMRDSALASRLKLLWLSPEIPLGPVLFNNRFGSAVGKELIDIILQLHSKQPVALQSIKDAWSEAKQTSYFIPVDKNYYREFMGILADKSALEKILLQFAE